MTEAHVRIDEGVKRGPRKPYAKRAGTVKARDLAGKIAPSIPKDLDPATVLARYLTEERTIQIAESYKVTRPALNMWLLDMAEEGWKKAQVARAVSRKEQAEDELEDANDPLSLARAREKLRGAQWDLERVFNRIYGQKQEVTHNLPTGPILQINLPVVPQTHIAQQQSQVIDVVSEQIGNNTVDKSNKLNVIKDAA